MSRTFEGAAQNSCYVFPGETTIAYKGMQSQRTWQLDIRLSSKPLVVVVVKE